MVHIVTPLLERCACLYELSLYVVLFVCICFCSGLMYRDGYSVRRIPEVVAHSGSALLHFFSDAAINMTGFNISYRWVIALNPLNPELNLICYLLALLAHHFLHVSRIRVKSLTLRLLMSYIYMEHLFLMFLDHTQRRTAVGRTPLDE